MHKGPLPGWGAGGRQGDDAVNVRGLCGCSAHGKGDLRRAGETG